MIARQFNKISVVGLGYIGLPTAAVIASHRVEVIGVDVNPDVVETINQGLVHIVEPDLDAIVKNTVCEGYLHATTKPQKADAFLICVPTPFKNHYQPDTSYIEAAARAIAPVLEAGNLVILESTSPVGTTEQLSAWLQEMRPDLRFPGGEFTEYDISIAHCPERVLPGQVIRELVENDRVVGGLTDHCANAAIELYKIFVKADCIATNVRTAEMCKLVENSYRDVNIAFANELSLICDKLQINTWELIQLANKHPRVNILQPGCGVGGHCIAVDPWFIVAKTPQLANLIKTARSVNNEKPRFVCDKIAERAKAKNTKEVIILGLTFKPNIDDTRESPAIEIVKLLFASGFQVNVYEPHLHTLPEEILKVGAGHLQSLSEVENASGAVVAVLVGHEQFKSNNVLNSIDLLDFVGITYEPLASKQIPT